MAAEIANRGDILIRGTGRFFLQNAANGRTAAEMGFGPLPVLPGGMRRIAVNRQEPLRPGKYLPFVEFNLGGRRLRARGAFLQVGP